MSVVQTLIGNIKGPQGAQGQTGATGATGTAATITVGTTTTTAYGNAAQVTNTGTQNAAVLNFVIPQGRPGQQTTTMGDLTLDSITTSMEDFPSPAINDTGKVVFGKIVKFFSDTLSRFTKHAGNVATISSSPTTQAFSAGDFLVYNDQLYKVTANIANGGTLTPGTNISSTSTGAQLTSLSDSLNYTFLGEYTGTNAVPLPSAWKEAYVCLLFPWNPLYGTPYTFIREQANAPGGQLRFSSGYYTSSSDYGSWVLELSNGNLYILSVQRNGTNQTSTAKIRVWYR